VTGAKQIDWLAGAWTDEAVAGLDPSRTYYLYCRSGNRSGQAAKLLRAKGFDSVFNAGSYDSLQGL
jgi:rhodanese-related sulfurtransferase